VDRRERLAEAMAKPMGVPRRRALDRAASAFLLTLMTFGCGVLWLGVPAGVLWLTGRVTEDPIQHLSVSLLAVPLAMIVCARWLFWLNRLHLRVAFGRAAMEADPDADEFDEPSWLRGPLEPLLVTTLILALIAMAVWFFVFAENPLLTV